MKKYLTQRTFNIVGAAAIVSSTIAGCFVTDKCSQETRDSIERTMNGLATKAFALYAAEKAGQANEKKNVCPKCGE